MRANFSRFLTPAAASPLLPTVAPDDLCPGAPGLKSHCHALRPLSLGTDVVS
jgi:hypothetical protein